MYDIDYDRNAKVLPALLHCKDPSKPGSNAKSVEMLLESELNWIPTYMRSTVNSLALIIPEKRKSIPPQVYDPSTGQSANTSKASSSSTPGQSATTSKVSSRSLSRTTVPSTNGKPSSFSKLPNRSKASTHSNSSGRDSISDVTDADSNSNASLKRKVVSISNKLEEVSSDNRQLSSDNRQLSIDLTKANNDLEQRDAVIQKLKVTPNVQSGNSNSASIEQSISNISNMVQESHRLTGDAIDKSNNNSNTVQELAYAGIDKILKTVLSCDSRSRHEGHRSRSRHEGHRSRSRSRDRNYSRSRHEGHRSRSRSRDRNYSSSRHEGHRSRSRSRDRNYSRSRHECHRSRSRDRIYSRR